MLNKWRSQRSYNRSWLRYASATAILLRQLRRLKNEAGGVTKGIVYSKHKYPLFP